MANWRFLILLFACAQSHSALAKEPPLFEDRSPLQITLTADLRSLCSHRDPECQAVPFELSVNTMEETPVLIPVGIKLRGDFRSSKKQCHLPLLFFYFEPEDVEGTVFEGQGVLPVTLQCKPRRTRYADYALKEYLAYRLYELYTPKSIRSRQVRLQLHGYENGRGKASIHAFFTEHFDSVAQRNGAERVEPDVFDLEMGFAEEITVMTMFQYLIGNTDWSVIEGHNMAYIAQGNKRITPLPFDFDFSGLVNAEYAGPPRKLPINSVRQRLYRGFCHESLDWNKIYQMFADHEAGVFESLSSVEGLSNGAEKDVRRFLQKFFAIIDSPEKRQKLIESRCRRH